MIKCAACRSDIEDGNRLECSTCSFVYHGLCVGVSPSGLDELSSDLKSSWLCPECCTKKPRSDNSNTPVRPTTSTPTSGSRSDAGVTLRRGKQGRPKTMPVPAAPPSPPVSPPPASCSGLCMSREDLRAIIKEELMLSLRESTTEIRGDISRELKAVRSEISSLTDSMNFINDSIENINTDIANYKSKVDTVLKENETLRSELNIITNRFNQLEQVSRASNLEIQCVPERKSENLLSMVEHLSKTVSCPVQESDILYCSRIAKKNPESPRPRSILIKLNSPRSRDTLLAATIKYNKSHPQERLNTGHLGFGADKKTAVYVTENLTPENKALHAAARVRAKELQYKHVWVRSGRIYMRKTDTSEYVLVRNGSTLEQLK